MDIVEKHAYAREEPLYVIELTRNDVLNLVHAAHMHSERLNAKEAKSLMDSAKRLSDQAVYFN
jgi:hypothetical protein